ncbi:MAG: hypothetical protein E5Y88_22365 [Mesorhizobium sp.]|uniref:hypothetical protein n=1 Tax=Mesorhizobium sp. TaxID=1871066 RepID=UPI0011F768DD|nr:hypothetical protein [Mesorhizobium sp.]TIL23672.1 MAG: hypothetical protein E5Y88_22365 [Mesorhizobium sp.]
MATAKQAVEIVDAVLRIPDGTSRWHADRLRADGLLPSTPGRPDQLAAKHVALLLLAVLTGLPALSSAPMIAEYAALRPMTGGGTLAETLAKFIESPGDFFELRVDQHAPGATITYRGSDHGMRVETFASPIHYPRPAFDRIAVLGADGMIRLSAALADAPPVRLGPHRGFERYRRMEYAIKF